MKKSIILSIIGIVIFASCKQNLVEPEVFRLPDSICIRIGSQIRTIFSNNDSSALTSDDTVLVFDDKGVGIEFTSTEENISKSVFTTESWTGDNPDYAVFSPDLSSVSYPTKDVIGISIPDIQTISGLSDHDKNAVSALGKVKEINGNYIVDEMKDVPAYVACEVATDNVAKIVIEGANGEFIAGDADVECSSFTSGINDFWTISTGKSQHKQISAVPADSEADTPKCFKAGVYNIAILPQTFTKGLKITYLAANGDILNYRNFGAKNGVVLNCGKFTSFDFNSLAETYPDTVVIDLNFHNEKVANPFQYPFAFGAKATFTRTKAGETWYYLYEYEYDNTPMQDKLPFIICQGNGKKGYEFRKLGSVNWDVPTKGFLIVEDAGTTIKLPGIPGKYLKEVYVSIENAAFKSVRICSTPSKESVIAYTYDKTVAGTGKLNAQTITFPFTFPSSTDAAYNAKAGQISTTDAGSPYYIYFDLGANHVVQIKLTYTDSLD